MAAQFPDPSQTSRSISSTDTPSLPSSTSPCTTKQRYCFPQSHYSETPAYLEFDQPRMRPTGPENPNQTHHFRRQTEQKLRPNPPYPLPSPKLSPPNQRSSFAQQIPPNHFLPTTLRCCQPPRDNRRNQSCHWRSSIGHPWQAKPTSRPAHPPAHTAKPH